ncbi:hypothetical protein [Acidaminococcus massiliensis]|jgi:hypothetical protein|uniref:hypothetical protein n=1 Tax=Acidaminococcus massiliensis TaxID=1852375 RepID=UPI002055E162|nr:hypothetical protein [Acidaminococcus massiliensis]DAR24879.1 MAG TPA: helix-turn-helix domain protein [Caudoviricetes sp.]
MRVLFELSVAEIKELLAKNQQKREEPVVPMMPTDKVAPVVSITSDTEPKHPVFGGNHTEDQKRCFSDGLKYFKASKNLSVSQFAKFCGVSKCSMSNYLYKPLDLPETPNKCMKNILSALGKTIGEVQKAGYKISNPLWEDKNA